MIEPLSLTNSPIHFGTDGWRGVLGVDVTIQRLLSVAAASAQELAYRAGSEFQSRKVIIGFDRRFLAPEFAEAIASAVRGCELEPLLASSPVPTPACSWAVVNRQALGALVITASHNPPEWLGLKIKGSFGGSVDGDFTKAVEKRLVAGGITMPNESFTERFNARKEHLDCLRSKIDVPSLVSGLKAKSLKVIVDPMHGSAAGCIKDLLGGSDKGLVEEIRDARDPLFGGNSPEPLANNLTQLIERVKSSNNSGQLTVGLAFDGDGDRIAAIDEEGNFCSTQSLMPLFIEHLVKYRDLPGCIVKTVSGSDLMSSVAKGLGRSILEFPVGFKYIASEMISGEVLVGGEESGGIGFGMHLPERDALFTALIMLEALVVGELPLGQRLRNLQDTFGGCGTYERRDIRLKSMASRRKLEGFLADTPPSLVAGQKVKEVIRIDGIKLRMGLNHWLMMRFSGTEPLLRIYCEAPNKDLLSSALDWAIQLAKNHE